MIRPLLVVLLTLSCSLSRAADAPAVLFRGGLVWTGDTDHPSAASILVEGDKIIAIGSDAEVARAVPKQSTPRIVELHGRRVLPGLIDSHIHIVGGGLQLERVDLGPARTRAETIALIVAYAKAHPDVPWIQGRGWSYDLWKPSLPTRQELDAALPNRAVFVRAYDGHSGWANSKALALAGIDEHTPDPKNGKIVREPGSQRPSGALLEEAMDLIRQKIPKTTVEERRRAIVAAGTLAASHGITAMCEVGGDLADLDVYEALDREHALPIRVVFGPAITDGVEAYATKRKTIAQGGLLTAGPLKGFVDGVVESGTAVMLAPFADGGAVAVAHILPPTLVDQIGRADALGIDVAYHCVGDGAVRSVLDAVEAVEHKNAPRERRPRIEHIEIVSPTDIPRFKKLGVLPSMMPIHSEPGDELDGGIWSKKIGAARLEHAFPFAELQRAGAKLIFGSDWPVASLDPLPAIATAVTRTGANGKPRGGWLPKQALTIDEALRGYTSQAAFGTRLDGVTGVLRAGMAADLVVLAAGARIEDPASLFHAKVDLTMVAGKVAYERKAP